jgi:hypothetical protein
MGTHTISIQFGLKTRCDSSKLRHYMLSSTCVVACRADVMKHMLQQPIVSGMIGKWVYALLEYDLAYEPLKSMKTKLWQISLLGII